MDKNVDVELKVILILVKHNPGILKSTVKKNVSMISA